MAAPSEDKGDAGSTKEKEETPEKSRWWDHYYVRYFVGSVFAVPLMLALSKTPVVTPLVGNIEKIDVLNATVLGAAGLAFCYLASAPILLLHAMRGRYSRRNHAKGWASNGSRIFAGIIIASAIGLGLWMIYGPAKPSSTSAWLSFVPLIVVVGAQVIGILRTPISAVVDFYQGLAKDRAVNKPEDMGRRRREYIQSYRDMREHGNALLILVMEGVPTTALLQATSAGALLAIMVLWVMPASFAWFIATRLEDHLHDVN